MEAAINEFDFMNPSEGDEGRLSDKLYDIIDEEAVQEMGKAGFVSLISTLTKKICVKGFPPTQSESWAMALVTVKRLFDQIEEMLGLGIITEKEVHDELLEFYIALLKSGPGSSHCFFLTKVARFGNFQKYIEILEGDRLVRLIEGFKAIEYIPEAGIKEEKQIKAVLNNYPPRMDDVLGERCSDRIEKPEIKKQFLDLYVFYLYQMPKMTPQYDAVLADCLFKMKNVYDGYPFKFIKDANTYRFYLKSIQEFICQPDFPQNDKIQEETAPFVDQLLDAIEGDNVLEIYEGILLFAKDICMCPNAEKFDKVFRELKDIRKVPKEKIEGNSKFFEIWAPIAAEVFQSAPHLLRIGEIWAGACRDFKDYTKPKKEYDKLWFPVIMAMVTWMHQDPLDAVDQLFYQDKWKRVWNWKVNFENAQGILKIFLKADYNSHKKLPEDEAIDSWWPRHVKKYIANIVQSLRDQLKIVKIADKIEVEIAELTMMSLEKCLEVESMENMAGSVSLKNHKPLVGEYLDRLYLLLETEEYPWEFGWQYSAVMDMLSNMITTFEGEDATTPDIDKKFNKMFLYAMEDGREFIDFTDGSLNIYGEIATTMLSKWVHLHLADNTVDKLKPLTPSIKRLMTSEEEEIQSTMQSLMAEIMEKSSELLKDTGSTEDILTLYIQKPDSNLLGALEAGFESAPDLMAPRFSELVGAFCKNKENNAWTTQTFFFKKVVEIMPKLFTRPGIMKMIFEHHYEDKDANSFTIQFMDELSKVYPEVMEPYLESHLLRPEFMLDAMAGYHGNIITRIACKYKKRCKIIYDFFVKRLRTSNYEWILYYSIINLREMLTFCGRELFTKEDRDLIDEFRTKAPTIHIKDAATDLINELAGVSLEKVAKDVKGHTGDIKKLNIGLAGTKVVVKRVQKDVKKQEKEIKQVKKDVEEVNEKVDQVAEDLEETKEKVEEIDKKTMSNAPTWSRDVTKIMNIESEHDWRLLASRLGYSPDDIRAWATQSDPCMALLSEWYATHKTFEASRGVLNALQEMDRMDAAIIVENAMKAAEGVVADEPVDYPEPPEVFLSYQWGHQNEVKLIHRHLEMAGYKCWMDVGQMGGGDKLFEKIDTGIRAAKIIICCVTEKYAKSPNCNREVNLSVNLGKAMIPLLIEKMAWPPAGSMGPIFSEYLFIRFFQRPGEETNDDRIWPAPKFVELLMQLNCLKVMPDETAVDQLYKNWWIPVVEKIVIPQRDKKKTESQPREEIKKEDESPEVFISYQWGKQKEISALYQKLTGLGLTCWMDIHQMGGGDSLYDKIDRGIRGCKVVVSSVTTKYSLSANCRREVSLADALKKPLIPMLMEKIDWPPSGPMSMVLTQLLYINFSKDELIQKTWEGSQFEELLSKIEEYVPRKETLSITTTTKTTPDEKRTPKKKSREPRPISSKAKQPNVVSTSDSKPSIKKANANVVKKQEVIQTMKKTDKSCTENENGTEKSNGGKTSNKEENLEKPTPNQSGDTEDTTHVSTHQAKQEKQEPSKSLPTPSKSNPPVSEKQEPSKSIPTPSKPNPPVSEKQEPSKSIPTPSKSNPPVSEKQEQSKSIPTPSKPNPPVSEKQEPSKSPPTPSKPNPPVPEKKSSACTLL